MGILNTAEKLAFHPQVGRKLTEEEWADLKAMLEKHPERKLGIRDEIRSGMFFVGYSTRMFNGLQLATSEAVQRARENRRIHAQSPRGKESQQKAHETWRTKIKSDPDFADQQRKKSRVHDANRRAKMAKDEVRMEKRRERSRKRFQEKYESDPQFREDFKIRGKLGSKLRRIRTGKPVRPDPKFEIMVEWLDFLSGKGLPNWRNVELSIEIDHVVPLSAFDLCNPQQVEKAIHWTNVRPATQRDNSTKAYLMPSLDLLMRHYALCDEFMNLKAAA